jgi:hypothetical protein
MILPSKLFTAPRVTTTSSITSDFVYIRFIGDRSISEKDFGTIQRDRAVEMLNWAKS